MFSSSLKLNLIEGGIRVVLPLLGVAMLAAGIFGLMSFTVQPLYEAMQTRQWVAVPARLESASVDAASYLTSRPLPALAVRFRYQYGSREYVGDRYDLHQGFERRSVIERNLALLRSGESLTAWVNSEEPSQAVLVRSLNWPLLTMGIPFAVVALVGGLLLLGGMVAWNQAPAVRRRSS